MEINGLPLHPLAVHAAVILAPIAALVALAYLRPAWRDRLRWPMLVLALVAAASVVLAYLSGNSFRDANDFFTTPPSEVTDQIDEHADLGTIALWVTLGFALIAALNAWRHDHADVLRRILGVLLALDAVAVLVVVILTGDSGAQAVWSGFNG